MEKTFDLQLQKEMQVLYDLLENINDKEVEDKIIRILADMVRYLNKRKHYLYHIVQVEIIHPY